MRISPKIGISCRAMNIARAVHGDERMEIGRGLHETGEEADDIADANHETRVYQDVVLDGPAELREILETLKAERTGGNT